MISSYIFRGDELVNITIKEITRLAILLENHLEITSVAFINIALPSLNLSKLRPIFSAIQNNQNIQLLSFVGTCLEDLKDSDVDILYLCVKAKDSVKFASNSFTVECPGVDLIIKLAATSKIHYFFCECNGIGKKSKGAMESVAKAFSNSEFKFVTLACNGIGSRLSCDEALMNLFRSKIDYLMLDGNSICKSSFEDSWEERFNILLENQYINGLSMAGCCLELLEDEGEGSFVDLLVNFIINTHMKTLNISRNGFSKKFIMKDL